MLIPRFTLRRLLLVMTASGVFFLVVRYAVAGATWATAIVMAVVQLLLAFLLFGAFFGLAYMAAALIGVLRRIPHARVPTATADYTVSPEEGDWSPEARP